MAGNITWVLTRIFMLLFLYSAVVKFIDFDEFRSELSKSPFLHPIAGFMAWTVPGSEAIVAGLLIFHRTQQIALYTYFYMMFAFTCYVFLMMEKAYYLPCACMGIFDVMGWKAHLTFNCLLTTLVLVAILLENGQHPKKERQAEPFSIIQHERYQNNPRTATTVRPSGGHSIMDGIFNNH